MNSNKNYKLLQKELLNDKNESLQFHFWAITIYQSYYISYMKHHPNEFMERIQYFEQLFFNNNDNDNDNNNNNNYNNNITFDHIRSYSEKIACKFFPRTLSINFSKNQNYKNNDNENNQLIYVVNIKIKQQNEKILTEFEGSLPSNDNESLKIDLPIECNYLKNNKIIIKIFNRINNNCIVEKSINEGDISGYTGYWENLSENKIFISTIIFKWIIRDDIIKKWPCNPSRFIPKLLTILLLKNDSMYYRFFESLFYVLCSNYKMIVLKSLPWLRLIITNDKFHIEKLAKIFTICYNCKKQQQNSSLTMNISQSLEIMIENFKIFYPSLNRERQSIVFEYLCKQIQKNIINVDNSIDKSIDNQLIIKLINMLYFTIYSKQKKCDDKNSNETIILIRKLINLKQINNEFKKLIINILSI